MTAGPLAISATASVDLGLEGLESPVCGITGLCVRIVTHHEAPSGSGVVREYDILPGIGDVGTLPGTPIDATGDGIPDLAVAVGVPPSGLPTIVDRQRPQIKIDRAAGAPASLPVKVEAVINDDLVPNGKISFGYDTRGSTAPTSFIARTDLRDRDGDAATEQKKVDLTISRGPSDRVALVTETFTARAGPGESQRTSREITRLTSS